MSSEMQDNTQAENTGEGNLSDALATGDGEFVTAEAPKPSLNQGLLYLL